MSVIVARDLTKFYGTRIGVENLSLEVAEGMIFGFLGPNGAGKTTTIRLLLGFLRADRGEARVLGRDCWRETAEIKARVGYLPGDVRLYPWMTARSGLRIAGAARGLDLAPRGQELIEFLELDPTVSVRDMSRGMRQKLALILTLAHDPDLLILDEPTSGLDPLTQERLYAHLRDCAERGNAVFFSSHVLSEVESLCDRVAILRAGRLVAGESLDSLKERAGRAVTIHFQERPAAYDAPEFLEIGENKNGVWKGSLRAPVNQLLDWLRDKPIADLSIGAPDLETLFRRYYEEDDPSHSPPAAKAGER